MTLSRLEGTLLRCNRGPFLSPPGDDGGGGGGDNNEEEEHEEGDEDLSKIEGLGDKGKAAIERVRAEKKVAKAEAKTLKEERDALLTEKNQREADERRAAEAAATEAGKFEELAQTREKERDTALADKSRLETENARLRKAVDDVIDAQWKELPAEVKEVYQGDKDDSVAKLEFLPKAKKLVDKLAEADGSRDGNGPGPHVRRNANDPPEVKSLVSGPSMVR